MHTPFTDMNADDQAAYWHEQLKLVLSGKRLTSAPGESERAAVARLTARLEEAERAHVILRGKGYGRSWMALDEIAQVVPERTETTPHT